MKVSWVNLLARCGFVALLLTSVNCSGQKGVRWAESSAPQIRVNQLGYFPKGAKWATLRSTSEAPLPVELHQRGRVVWKGTSHPRGIDEASGDPVHHIDFSEVHARGTEYVLRAGDAESFPFQIADDIYATLPYDALKYFYHNRSGVPIVLPYITDLTHSRPAGHMSDSDVPCWLAEDCSYRLDVRGGWYDAGDHGKYVVNGGISAWTLLSLYERLVHLSGRAERFKDGSLNIPESGNGVPDLLDEARWEVEFLLRMQVPAGQPLQGMAHHKIHDHAWTPLATEPPETTDQRALHPPSTAATLNLAAVAAQASRLWKVFDPAFSTRCLTAAEGAYQAALREPNRLAPELDKQGGGPYSDPEVSDEFFWAESELFVTTGKSEYLTKLSSRSHFSEFPTRLRQESGRMDGDGVTGSMTWQSTAALGWISLAVVPSALDAKSRDRFRDGIVRAATEYARVIDHEGYRVPLGLGESKKYPWGSNSFVLNNMVILALAHDFTKEVRFARGVAEGMDYLLGRNPVVQSYITGYGTNPITQPHHRFWAHSLNPEFPPPPPGAVSGGPNSSLQDPQSRRSGLTPDLPPQKCFVDHIDAWSVNEIAINWNAPLAYVAVFLDDWRGQ